MVYSNWREMLATWPNLHLRCIFNLLEEVFLHSIVNYEKLSKCLLKILSRSPIRSLKMPKRVQHLMSSTFLNWKTFFRVSKARTPSSKYYTIRWDWWVSASCKSLFFLSLTYAFNNFKILIIVSTETLSWYMLKDTIWKLPTNRTVVHLCHSHSSHLFH